MLSNAQCVQTFLFKYWESGSFFPKQSSISISMTDVRDTFGGEGDLEPCKSFTYILTALTKSGKVETVQG